jgi:transcriptional regulator with XRE-family HTH domain
VRLRQARERLGISARALSRLARIPLATVSAVERGREPRWSTLMRYLETVPGLRAGHLVEGSHPRPPTLGASTWAFAKRAHGLWAQRVIVRARVREDGSREHLLEVKGLTTSDADQGARTLRMLMQVACVAAPAVIRELGPPEQGRKMALDADGARHEFRWTARLPRVLEYRRTESLPRGEPDQLTHRTGLPIRELTLVVELPKGAPTHPRLCAWASARDLEGEGSSAVAYLHAPPCSPTLRRGGRTTRATVRDVIPGVTHALVWGAPGSAAPKAPGAGARPRTFAVIAREVRARAGLSVRETARSLAVSHGTLLEAEKGSDPRASTLRQYLRAFPELAPQWLLPAAEAEGELTLDEAWEYYRDLVGLEAQLFDRRIRIDENGNTEGDEVIHGLVSLDSKERDISLILGRGRWIYAREGDVIQEVDTDLPDDAAARLRTRIVERHPTYQHQQLLIPAGITRRGMRLRSRITSRSAFRTRAVMRALHGDEIIVRGNSRTMPVPCREYRMVLAWHELFVPDDAWPIAFSSMRPATEDKLGRLEILHPGRYEFRTAPGLTSAELRVERPVPGISYGIGMAIHLSDRSKG